jgi:hypothetical protein
MMNTIYEYIYEYHSLNRTSTIYFKGPSMAPHIIIFMNIIH